MKETMQADLDRLHWEIEELSYLYNHLVSAQLEIMVYPEWSVLDVLRHLVWWHESFASIAHAAMEGRECEAPRGSLAEVNVRSVAELSGVGVRSLLQRLRSAQRGIDDCEAQSADKELGYRKGARRYTFAERIQISINEISTHRHDVLLTVLSG